MHARILPGLGSGGRSRTCESGTARPSCARRCSAGRSVSKSSMMPCIVSWGVCAGRTASAMLTTPCAVITPGTTSSVPAAWKSTSLTASSSTRLSRWYCTPIMKTIDIHAHLVPRSLWQAVDARRDWYGFRHEAGDGLGTMLGNGRRTQFNSPKVRFTPEERLKDMDAQGVDVQVVSIHTPFFGYHLDPAQGRQLAREVNDEIAAMTKQWPARFAGLGTLPVQDVKAAIDELERAVTVLGLKGVELDTVVNGENWDEAKFLPLFKAAEAMGAVLFFHPQPPSSYQRRLYYDTVVGSEKALRFLLDEVGADRVVLGSDWPFVPWHPSPVAWVQGLKTVTQDEKDKILWRNLESLLTL